MNKPATPYRPWEFDDLVRAIEARKKNGRRTGPEEMRDEEIERLIATINALRDMAGAAKIKGEVPVFELPASDPLSIGLAEYWKSLRGGGTFRQREILKELKAAARQAPVANPVRLQEVESFITLARVFRK